MNRLELFHDTDPLKPFPVEFPGQLPVEILEHVSYRYSMLTLIQQLIWSFSVTWPFCTKVLGCFREHTSFTINSDLI